MQPENIVIMDDGAVMLADIGSMLPNDEDEFGFTYPELSSDTSTSGKAMRRADEIFPKLSKMYAFMIGFSISAFSGLLSMKSQLEYGHDRLHNYRPHNYWSLDEEPAHHKELSEALASSFDRIGAFKVPPKLNGVNVENLKKLVSYDTFERPDVLAEGFNLDIFLMVKACAELPSEVGS